MIVVRVELWSALTGQKTEIAPMQIANDGTWTESKGDYVGRIFRGRNASALDEAKVTRIGIVRDFPRKSTHVWALVARMLKEMGHT